MTKALKVGIGAALLGVLIFVGVKMNSLRDLASKLTYKIVGFGRPVLSNWMLTVPLTAQFANPTLEQVTIDRLQIAISFWTGQQYTLASRAEITRLSIVPGTNSKSFTASADLKAIGGSALKTLQTIMATRTINIKAEVTPTVGGFQLPPQTITENVQL